MVDSEGSRRRDKIKNSVRSLSTLRNICYGGRVLYAVKYPKMKLIPIQVECYAGTKADETPRRFFREEQPVEVEAA